MRSLYDVLGARVNDDAQAIKKAFRTAVKAYHPDLHPGDPDAVLRFRRIVTANAILRDEKQRAAYDQMLGLGRQQIKLRLDQQLLQLQYQRRRRLKVGAGATVAVVAVCALAIGYGLLMPMPTTAIVEIMKDRPATARTATIVETIKKDKVAASAVASLAGAKVSEAAPAAARVSEAASPAAVVQAAGNDPDKADGTGVAPAHVMPAEAAPARKDANAPPAVPDGGQAIAQAAAAAADGALKAGVAPPVADKGGNTFAMADRGPLPATPDADLYRDLGTVSYRIGDFPQAIVNLDKAIRLAPNDAKAYNIRGNAWDEIGAFDNALADYDAAIRIDPNNPVFFHDRAIMWHRQGNLDSALVDLDRAIRFNFADPNIYCDRGLIWYERGSHARAVADFNHAVKIDPDFAAACISRGLILHRNSEFNIAFADLGRTIRVSPGVFDVSRRRAEIVDHGSQQGQSAPKEVAGRGRRRSAGEAAADFRPGGCRDPAVSQRAGNTGRLGSAGGVQDGDRRGTGHAPPPSEPNAGRRGAHRIVPHPGLDARARDTVHDPVEWGVREGVLNGEVP